MDIGEAIRAARTGARITRPDWKEGMFVAYQQGYPDGIPINANTAAATGVEEGTVCSFLPYLMLRTAAGPFVPWVVDQTDALAEDWVIA